MPSTRVLGAVAVLAVVCTALAFVLYFRLIAEVGADRWLIDPVAGLRRPSVNPANNDL